MRIFFASLYAYIEILYMFIDILALLTQSKHKFGNVILIVVKLALKWMLICLITSNIRRLIDFLIYFYCIAIVSADGLDAT